MVFFITTTAGSLLLVALCMLSAGSFAPQLARLWSSRDSSGISLIYVLLNLVSATHQLTAAGFYVDLFKTDSLWLWRYPLGPTDWINYIQLLIVWAGMLLLFIACLATSSQGLGIKFLLTLLYLQFFLINFGIFIHPCRDPNEQSGGWIDLSFINLLVRMAYIWYGAVPSTILTAAALYPQYRTILSRQPTEGLGGLSLSGLHIQAAVFAALGLSWVFRVPFEAQYTGDAIASLYGWYIMVGWAAVNNGIFAVVQGLLFQLGSRRMTVAQAKARGYGILAPLKERLH